jgi:hypothetical protein
MPGTLTLDAQEREELLRLLTHALEEKRVEVHRTRTLSYQADLQKEEEVIRGILDKVKALSA